MPHIFNKKKYTHWLSVDQMRNPYSTAKAHLHLLQIPYPKQHQLHHHHPNSTLKFPLLPAQAVTNRPRYH